MSDKTKERCGNCFFVHVIEEDAAFFCRRYPPVKEAADEYGIRPRIFSDGWCGEWKAGPKPEDAILDKPIDKVLDLSSRSRNALIYGGINTIRDILNKIDTELPHNANVLLYMRYIGKLSMYEIITKLEELNIILPETKLDKKKRERVYLPLYKLQQPRNKSQEGR